MRLGVDISNHQGYLTTQELEGWRADDTAVILGCQRSVVAIAQWQQMRMYGIEPIALYCFLYWGYDPLAEVHKAIAVAEAIGFTGPIFIDCENDKDSLPQEPDQRLRSLRRAVEDLEEHGYPVGIYTNGPFWANEMANSTEFSRLPLWYANWTTSEPITTVDFGGWTDVAIHQYTSTPEYPYYGRTNLDMNWVIKDLNDEEDMARIDDIEERLDAVEAAIDAMNKAVLARFDILLQGAAIAAQPDIDEAYRDQEGLEALVAAE